MRVSIVGTGYVGLVSGACLAEKGNDVVCVDLDEGKVDRLLRGQPTIRETGLDALLKRHAGRGLRATTDLASAVEASDLTLIAVGTPFDGKSIDLSQVNEAARNIGAALRRKPTWHSVIVKSTVVPGTTEDTVLPILEKESGKQNGRDFGVGMNPEFLTEGEAVHDFMEPDRLVLGALDVRTLSDLETLYAGFPGVPLVRCNPRTAEMIKYASNTLLATLISWSNELANLGSAIGGIDALEVVEGLRLSRYLTDGGVGNGTGNGSGNGNGAGNGTGNGGHPSGATRSLPSIASFLLPGCGFGGSCLPKDTAALAAQGRALGVPMRVLEAVVEVNRAQPSHVVELLEKRIPDLKGVPVAVLGLAFRPGTGDLRESPAIPIIRDLLARGAKVEAYDPAVAEETAEHEASLATSTDTTRGGTSFSDWHPTRRLFGGDVRLCPTLEEALDGTRAAVIVTRWPEFGRLPELLEGRQDPPIVVDGRRMLDKGRVMHYEGIGL